jgi:alanine racemase
LSAKNGADRSVWRGRATRAEIDLGAVAGNVFALLSVLPHNTGLVAVVKANAYGHGAKEVARAAVRAGAVGLAVATVGEGRALRKDGIDAPILVLGAIDLTEASAAIDHDLDLTVGTEDLLVAIQAEARRRASNPHGPISIHVKVDTGLRRYGAEPGLALSLARRIDGDPFLALAGVFTHFASADEEDDGGFTDEQAGVLKRFMSSLSEEGIRPRSWHLANSAGTLNGWAEGSGFVRIGIALYGVAPSSAVRLAPGMRPVMTLRSRIARVFDLDHGDTVGYGRTYRCASPERAALVPLGYGDGYRRALSDKGWMGISGDRADVIGRVSMDQTVVRLPKGSVAEVGEEVTVMGGLPEEAAPTAEEMASLCGTIPYEIFTGIATRVPRLFLRNGDLVSFDDGLR